jgi:hypothetical protein
VVAAALAVGVASARASSFVVRASANVQRLGNFDFTVDKVRADSKDC